MEYWLPFINPYINITGLLLDGIATLGLFFIVSARLSPIDPMVFMKYQGDWIEKPDQVLNELNNILLRYEKEKQAGRRKARIWFILLILGLLLQIISALIPIFTPRVIRHVVF